MENLFLLLLINQPLYVKTSSVYYYLLVFVIAFIVAVITFILITKYKS